MKNLSELYSRRHTAPKGFTLIELLVVIGLIGILAAGIGIALRDGNPTAALKAGQNSITTLVSSARGQAALNQSDAMVIVDVTPDTATSDTCLRSLQVVVRAGPGLDQWRSVGNPIILPAGIYVVPPPSSSITGVTFSGSWTDTRKSKGFQTTSGGAITERAYDAVAYPYYPTNAFSGRSYLRFQVFNSLGQVSNPATLLVTSGKKTGPSAVSLDNSEMVRGLLVSRYGVATLINESSTFDQVSIP